MIKLVKLGKNIDGYPVAEVKDICEICEEDYSVPDFRCTNCGIRICYLCWKDLSGNDTYKNCPECMGVLYN